MLFGGKYTPGRFQSKTSDGKLTREYNTWRTMLQRCNAPQDFQVTYESCEVGQEFLDFQFFAAWCHEQIGWDRGFHLDKDIILRGNRVYSPDVCVFVPREINNQLTLRSNHRGDYPIGVNKHQSTGRYQARLNTEGARQYLGLFKTPEEAFARYKLAKEAHMKHLAEKWKAEIDPRVVEALSKWEIKIDD